MSIVFIENVPGSGQVITVMEEFRGRLIKHDLRPGDNARIAVSRFKSVVVSECLGGGQAFALDLGVQAPQLA